MTTGAIALAEDTNPFQVGSTSTRFETAAPRTHRDSRLHSQQVDQTVARNDVTAWLPGPPKTVPQQSCRPLDGPKGCQAVAPAGHTKWSLLR